MKSAFKSYLTCVAGWMLADALFVLIRFVGLDTVPAFATLNYESFNHTLFFTRSLLVGIVIGSIFYMVSRSFEKPAIRRRPYGLMITIQAMVSVFFVLILLIVQRAREVFLFDKELSFEFFASRIFTINFLVILTYYTIVSFLFVLLNQIDRKFGPGNLLKLIKGTYYHPRSIEHIFMFLDLRDSTAHAERLGHLEFGSLIQDCFMDMSIVSDYRAEFYQYVGDESILYWNVDDGVENANCLQAYFAFCRRLRERNSYYKDRYGMIPEFKAGVNIGFATVLEVGEVKREIAYLGDVLNTAARIQGQCKVYNENLMISEALRDRLKTLPGRLSIQPVGNIQLRGRIDAVELYCVREHTVADTPVD